MSRSGREALPDVQVWSRGPPGCLGVVWIPSRMSLRGGRTSRMPGVFGKPSQMSGSGREYLPYDRESSGGPSGSLGGPPGCSGVCGGPPECPGVNGSHSRMTGSSRESISIVREALPDVR